MLEVAVVEVATPHRSFTRVRYRAVGADLAGNRTTVRGWYRVVPRR